MNWQNYKFFSVWIHLDVYEHLFWVDGDIFTYRRPDKNFFVRILHPNKIEVIQSFPLEKECNNYRDSIKYWNIISFPNNIDTYHRAEYIKKIMNRETNLEKILNSI